eukprot:CAMPEP_0168363432 /NCGR_PEP_ID=MMETSP0228-20121227/3687_1 /TAXON_ID=133427 /ORGANISM="Protoceratium reticulatum, Strain CCCM 535 (=CCMP 1889)" /LENGTH=190 /DNA_ID=CAMNT_0008376157 /DNA_START=9 /DNA_END=581 /DNA_ORIENTATION=-
MAASLPSLGLPDSDHQRLMRRLEHNARARETASKLEGTLSVGREQLRQQLKKDRSQFVMDMHTSHQERVERWVHKTKASPLSVDLWAEDQKAFEAAQAKDRFERLQRKRQERLQREAHSAICARAMSDVDELEQLRAEKRSLVANEKELKALRDMEKTNARCAKVFQMRRARELEKQQIALERAMSSPTL